MGIGKILAAIGRRATMNGALVGTGGSAGLSRLARLAGAGLRAADRATGAGALLGTGKGQPIVDAVRKALHNPGTGMLKRRVLERYAASWPNADANKFLSEMYDIARGKADDSGLADHLFRAGAEAAKGDPGIVTEFTDALRRHINEVHTSVNQRAAHGSPVRRSDLGDAVQAPGKTRQPWNWGSDSMLLDLGHKGDKATIQLRPGAAPSPTTLSDNIYMSGQNLGGLFFIEAPVAAGGKDQLVLMQRAGKAARPMGTYVAADMAEQMTRNPESGWRVVGEVQGPWYDKAGMRISMPKYVMVNDAGAKHADEYRSIFEMSGDTVVPTTSVRASALQDIKDNNDISAAKLRWFDKYGPFTKAEIPDPTTRRAQILGVLPDAGWYEGMDADRAGRLADFLQIPEAEREAFLQDFARRQTLTDKNYIFRSDMNQLGKQASAKPFTEALARLVGKPAVRTLSNAYSMFKSNPKGAAKETLLRMLVDGPGGMLVQGVQNPRSLWSNKELYRSLRRAPRNVQMKPDEILDLVRKFRTSQALALGAAGTGMAATSAMAMGGGTPYQYAVAARRR